MATIDLAAFRERESQGLITCRLHPTHDLLIWNYTAKTQFEHYWTPETMMCRGLITRSDGTVAASPFKKFFNIEEVQDIPLEPFKVTEKMDGSLGILYFADGKPFIATRGSFTSEQAIKGTQILQEKYAGFPFKEYYTYLFEIVYKSNRIVIDYGDMEDLVLLAVIQTETGKELDIHDPMWIEAWPFPIVKHYDGIADIAKLREMEAENKEGFVICFESGLRVKAKYAEYVRLHAVITQTTARTIWEYLKDSKPMTELLDRVPDEFLAWIKATTKDLSGRYQAIHQRTQAIYKEITAKAIIPTPIDVGATLNVKEVETISRAMKKYIQEQFAQYSDIEPFLLLLYSGGSKKKEQLREAIWESLYPEATRPFILEDEG